MTHQELVDLTKRLQKLSGETEWVEFKANNENPEDIGEYLSAIANSATLHAKECGYIIWGLEDGTHKVVGTKFRPRQRKVGNEELENWLLRLLVPRLDLRIHEFDIDGTPLVLFEVPPTQYSPVRFRDTEWIRVGSYKKKLKDFPEKERGIWRMSSSTAFEREIAKRNLRAEEVLELLDYTEYFRLSKQSVPETRSAIMERLTKERIAIKIGGGLYNVTNLGALLFARRLDDFEGLARKAVRVIVYSGNNRVSTIREYVSDSGYASGFESLAAHIREQLPVREVIGEALRSEIRMYPQEAIRELLPNAMIHQDLFSHGDSPMVEIFSDRIEFTNPGTPLIDPLRFIDEPPQSRNESLASLMRRLHICEERGSGIDKVVYHVEAFQLPAPEFSLTERHTKAVLFAHKTLARMTKLDKVRACYQHACLRRVSNEEMSNASLRKRFGVQEKNYPMVSRIIADTLDAGLIKPFDPDSSSKKHARYVPFWA